MGCAPTLPPYLSGLRQWPPPPSGCGAGKESAARRERSATRGHLSTPAVGVRIGPFCQEEIQRGGPRRKRLRWGVRLIRSRSPLSLLVRERRATGASPSAPPTGGQEQGAVGGKKQKTPGARRRLFENPPTPPHAPARCRTPARCCPGSRRERTTSWEDRGFPRATPCAQAQHPRAKEAAVYHYLRKQSNWTSEAKPRPLRTCE